MESFDTATIYIRLNTF